LVTAYTSREPRTGSGTICWMLPKIPEEILVHGLPPVVVTQTWPPPVPAYMKSLNWLGSEVSGAPKASASELPTMGVWPGVLGSATMNHVLPLSVERKMRPVLLLTRSPTPGLAPPLLVIGLTANLKPPSEGHSPLLVLGLSPG